jgi:hypothetical protein
MFLEFENNTQHTKFLSNSAALMTSHIRTNTDSLAGSGVQEQLAGNRASRKREKFLYMRESFGGTLAFVKDKREMDRKMARMYVEPGLVGTMWCYTCVGVAWPVDEDRMFLAHFNGWR